jgi:hypothetical protein
MFQGDSEALTWLTVPQHSRADTATNIKIVTKHARRGYD